MDVDTVSCATIGLRNVHQIAKKYDFHFTTFFLCGRPIVRRHAIKNQLLKLPEIGKPKLLSPLQKQSLRSLMETLLVNPYLRKYSSILTDLVKDGHEVGLHGGRNHGRWASEAPEWDAATIESELGWALRQLEPSVRSQVMGFSSPEWTSSGEVEAAVERLGFRYIADSHGPGPIHQRSKLGLSMINTGGCGEPGGIGFIEYLDANFGSRRAKNEVLQEILNRGLPSVFYDHPGYVGLRGRSTFEWFLEQLKAAELKICTVRDVLGMNQHESC
jgi:peptidoglycan/xylan/chitin deacetylase (PgdA/CDA1 family)